MECPRPGMPLLTTDAVVSTLLRLYSDPGVRTHQSHGDGGLRCWTCPCWSHPTLTCPTPKSRTGWSVPPLLCCPVSGAGQACSSSPPPSYLALLPFSHWWTLYLHIPEQVASTYQYRSLHVKAQIVALLNISKTNRDIRLVFK